MVGCLHVLRALLRHKQHGNKQKRVGRARFFSTVLFHRYQIIARGICRGRCSQGKQAAWPRRHPVLVTGLVFAMRLTVTITVAQEQVYYYYHAQTLSQLTFKTKTTTALRFQSFV